MEKKKLDFITLSDVHHGAKSVEAMKSELDPLLEFIIDEVNTNEEFIGVFITGDYFDKKLDLNDPRATYAISFLLNVYDEMVKHNKWFIVIRGTYSHDLSQLDFLKNLEASYNKFIFARKVQTITIEGMDVLLLPEEYPTDMVEYYKEFFCKKYDLCLGHGFFDWNCFDSNENEKSIPQMPIFKAEDFIKMVNLTIFGHDHTHKSYKDQIYYNGSYSRWSHNDETPKGCLYVEYHLNKTSKKNNSSHQVSFVENTLAPRYITINSENFISKTKLSKDDLTLDQFVKAVNNFIAKNDIYNLKIKFTKNSLDDKLIEVIKNYYNNKNNVMIESASLNVLRTNENTLNENSLEDNESESNLVNEYEFLFEHDTIINKIQKFILTKYNGQYELTNEEISMALSN